jgi:aspartate racemase
MPKPKNKILGILGGLGPMSSAYFYKLITMHTHALCDQDHIDIVISSKASTPDRTAFILKKSTNNPFDILEEEAKRLITYGADVIAMPCNTAHFFYERLNKVASVPVLNMVNLTVMRAKELNCKKIGILATDGTICTNTYQDTCMDIKIPFEIPSPAAQKELMNIIYGDIKAGQNANMQIFNSIVHELLKSGCDKIILGCTELSLIEKSNEFENTFIDSLDVLAKAAIIACGKMPQKF